MVAFKWFKKKAGADSRRRIIRETEVGLAIALTFPERMPHIPAAEVSTASFDPAWAERFWEDVLGDVSDLNRFAHRNPHTLTNGDAR